MGAGGSPLDPLLDPPHADNAPLIAVLVPNFKKVRRCMSASLKKLQ
jgi:hypothetical protein